MARVTVVIPNWNRRDLLEHVLHSLGRQTVPPDEVLVVDNGSEDDSVGVARRLGARVIEMGRNTGFSRAVNEGIRRSVSDWVAVVNNDVELEHAWLERLIDVAERSGAWFATGKIYRSGTVDILDGTFDAVSRAGCAWRCGRDRKDGPMWTREEEISIAPFTAAVFRRELFEEVGFLDEDLGSYMEDVDFGLRCALADRTGRYFPGAVAHHAGSATLGACHPETVRLLSRNQLLLLAKHCPSGWLLRHLWPLLVGQLLWGVLALRHGAGWAYCKGKLDGLRASVKVRRSSPQSPKAGLLLCESERQIRSLQERTGFDWYWRWYFALT